MNRRSCHFPECMNPDQSKDDVAFAITHRHTAGCDYQPGGRDHEPHFACHPYADTPPTGGANAQAHHRSAHGEGGRGMSSVLAKAEVTGSRRANPDRVTLTVEVQSSFRPLAGSTIGVLLPDVGIRDDVCAIRGEVVDAVQEFLAERRSSGRLRPASVREEARLYISVFMAIRNERRATVSREVASRIAWQVVDEAAASAGKE